MFTVTRPPALSVLVALLAVVALGGAGCIQSQADAKVDIGGYSLGVHCTGSGSPTVILEHGLGSNSGSWDKVQPSVSEFTRVCSYDRAGLGKSDDRPDDDIAGGEVADELQALITAMDLEPPFVFAAHSIGALYTSLYVARYPQNVAGIVFVDPTHEDQFARFDAEYQIPHFADEGGTHIDLAPVIAELQRAPGYGSMPVISLTAGKILNPVWLELRRDYAARSTNSMLGIATDSGHSIHRHQPDVVIRAIQLVVESARTHAPMPQCEASIGFLEVECQPVR